MKIYEFQAKKLFSEKGIPVPFGKDAGSINEAEKVINEFPNPRVVIKAQVYVGGRGKAGGIKLADNIDEAMHKASQIFSMKIKGLPVKRILIEEQLNIDREFYLSFIQDRDNRCYQMIFSSSGGIDIEDLAENHPEKIIVKKIKFFPGLQSFQIREILSTLKDLKSETKKEIYTTISNLFKFFIENDATLAEINPLVITKSGKCFACDAKVIFDDNSLFRHKYLLKMRIPEEEDPYEREAKDKNLNYVKLDGNIGCMVNGAGLAMATMDVIKYFGGEPANFLDIGGGAKSQQVEDALHIILKDKNVKSLFINIFGGIVRCDLVAQGIVSAKSKLDIDKPMVIRLIGTNDAIAYKILEKENIKCFTEMSVSAKEIVKITNLI